MFDGALLSAGALAECEVRSMFGAASQLSPFAGWPLQHGGAHNAARKGSANVLPANRDA